MTAPQPALALIDVSKSFGKVHAVQEVSLAVRPGELVGLVGPDGAGKTTLARLAAGALAPSHGRVEPESRGRVGYLSGRFSLYPDLTVWENLHFFAQTYGMRKDELDEEGSRLLAWVGLEPFRSRLAGALSGGMRQKLALACAVVHHPPTLILDEPTTAVDPIARAEFWRLLQEQAHAGRAVLVTTPYLDEATYCDRVGLLHRGRLLAMETATALIERLPYQMAMLTSPSVEGRHRRGELIALAESLPGIVWTQPLGTGVRVALQVPELPGIPDGYALTPVPPTLEDTYLWLSDYAAEVMKR